MPTSFSGDSKLRSRFAIWRIVTLLVLLLAIFGIFMYSVHAWRLASMLDASGKNGHAPLMHMLAWDVAYLVAACITVTASAGTLLRRGWARPVLRVVAIVLALWMLATAIMLASQWNDFSHHSAELMAQSGMGDAGRALFQHVRRSYMVAMALKAVAVLVLAWLAWRLGVPAVRGQFPSWRKKQLR